MFLPSICFAWRSWDGMYGSSFDPNSGNSYQWRKDYSGNTYVNGNNFQTGAVWNTTIQPNGDMNGYDSQQNYWNYNAQTGNYWNTNGTTCWGFGQFRQCN